MGRYRKALVVGASGQVGAALGSALERQEEHFEVIRTSRVPRPGWITTDLARIAGGDEAASLLQETRPDLVLCTGGMTFVDGCERSSAECLQVNAYGPAALAAQAYRQHLGFVFFSSDYVFGGESGEPGPYAETAMTRPLSVYGQSKLLGEQRVLEGHPKALIIRTTVVYGPDAAAKNYLYTLLRHLWSGARLRVPQDQISTPTYNRDLAEAVLQLLAAEATGIVHVAGPEVLDRLQFAERVARFFELRTNALEGVRTASLEQAALRPLYSGLATTRLHDLLPELRLRSLHEALRDCEAAMRSFLAALET